MTPRATRITPDAQIGELERRLEAMSDELEHAARVADRYRVGLVRIANSESGVWGTIARDTLRADPDADT